MNNHVTLNSRLATGQVFQGLQISKRDADPAAAGQHDILN